MVVQLKTALRLRGGQFWRRLLILCLMGLCLTGCVDYDLAIQFKSQTAGQLTQTLHLDPRLLTFNQASVNQWLAQFETRAKSLSGRVKRVDKETIRVTLPFYNGDDLVKKFNTLFADGATSQLNAVPGLPAVTASLALRQKNYGLALRNRLTYDLDLRALDVPALDQFPSADQGLISNLQVLNLSFQLQTPWGIQGLPEAGNVPTAQVGNITTWQLTPGSLNHLEVIFWVPSPIGLGALGITILMAVGYGLKYWVLRSRQTCV